MLQQRAKVTERAQVIAALNIYNSLFMVGGAARGILCPSVFVLSIPQLFALLAVLNVLVALYIFPQVPILPFAFWCGSSLIRYIECAIKLAPYSRAR